MRLVAVDPGDHPGYAVFENGRLVFAEKYPPAGFFDVLVIEVPQVYPGLSSGRSNDLITLAFTAGLLASALSAGRRYRVLPRDWKGQLEKTVCHARLARKLSEPEVFLLKGRPHDVWDAAGIGKWAIERMAVNLEIGRAF